jgi:hypothetical protein
MRKLWRTRLDGTPRYGNGVVPKPLNHRSRQTNGKRRYHKGSSAARRLDDLMRDYLRDFDAPDEAAIGLARAAALAAARIERCEEREVKGEAIDDERLVRLMGAHTRALAALNTMRRAKAQPVGGKRELSPLAKHLWAMHAASSQRRTPSPGVGGGAEGKEPRE